MQGCAKKMLKHKKTKNKCFLPLPAKHLTIYHLAEELLRCVSKERNTAY